MNVEVGRVTPCAPLGVSQTTARTEQRALPAKAKTSNRQMHREHIATPEHACRFEAEHRCTQSGTGGLPVPLEMLNIQANLVTDLAITVLA